jgi:hypothetical protein
MRRANDRSERVVVGIVSASGTKRVKNEQKGLTTEF